ncbi:MAG: DUF3786 domain-containing protein [Nitrospirae bacterium]|nr:MAG: DUF3786 domain-containing protein [Nitrospirota bacterium]
MELIPIKIDNGEEKAWGNVCGLPRKDVCRKTGALFDEKAGAYRIKCFGRDFLVNPCEMGIKGASDNCGLFLGKLKDFFRVATLWYMSSARDIPQTGRLVRPVDVKGGHRFTVGTHVLPLDAIAARFKKDPEGFIKKGQEYGAEVLSGYGDAYIKLYPFPRVPVTMLLWLEDEEFPAKVDLFFDSTCELQLSLSDVIWAVSMMCCLVMLED